MSERTFACGGVTFRLFSDARAWEDVFDAEGIEWWFEQAWDDMPPVTVRVYPRADCERVYVEHYPGPDGEKPQALPPYSFRGWADHKYADGPTIFLFVDETETADSIRWLLLHELTHIAVRHAPFLMYLFAFERDADGLTADDEQSDEYVTNDDLHERMPEEVFCNRLATAFFGGEACYDRRWWRDRVNSAMREAA